jgi:hypothetical protein
MLWSSAMARAMVIASMRPNLLNVIHMYLHFLLFTMHQGR